MVAPALTVVVPAYCEERFIAGSLLRLADWIDAQDRTVEVVVVTADAPDHTADEVRRVAGRFARFQHLEPGPKAGKGRDVRVGMLAARGDVVVFMDADLATPLRHLGPMVERLAAGADVVVGTRDLTVIHADWLRRSTSLVSNWLVRALAVPGISDTQCGFKGFRRAACQALFMPLVTVGWGFDFEVLARARHLALTIETMPIPDWRDPKGDDGLVGENIVSAQLRTFGELIRVRRMLGTPPRG